MDSGVGLGHDKLASTPSYERRRPEQTALYQVINDNLLTFRAKMDEADRPLPGYVWKEFERYLSCGILANGFARVRCPDCGHDRLVAFACKTRSLCTSCVGRQMNSTAAHLADNVMSGVPVRHWILTLPPPLRYLLAYKHELCSKVLKIFVREVFGWQRRLAKALFGLKSVRQAHPAGITAIHRASSHLALNIHYHSLIADGVYVVEDENEPSPVFRALPAPSKAEIDSIAWQTCLKVTALLKREGLWIEEADDCLDQDEPGLAACMQSSVQGVLLFGKRPGQRVTRFGGYAVGFDDSTGPKVPAHGFCLHAKRRISAHDPKGLEKLARYVLRPPVSSTRLELLPDGRVSWKLKRAFSDGTTHFVFEPVEFLAKLAAIVAPPRRHKIRYHGCWARRSKLRNLVAPNSQAEEEGESSPADCAVAPKDTSRKYHSWAKLLARVFKIDVLECPKCQARMQNIAWINQPKVIRRILKSVGLPADSPVLAPSRLPTQGDLFAA